MMRSKRVTVSLLAVVGALMAGATASQASVGGGVTTAGAGPSCSLMFDWTSSSPPPNNPTGVVATMTNFQQDAACQTPLEPASSLTLDFDGAGGVSLGGGPLEIVVGGLVHCFYSLGSTPTGTAIGTSYPVFFSASVTSLTRVPPSSFVCPATMDSFTMSGAVTDP